MSSPATTAAEPPLTASDRRTGGVLGAFIGDALAVPVHWYYNLDLIAHDYGAITDYVKPRNPHPESILWRTQYRPLSAQGDILHDQVQFYGLPDIHYHQFLEAGENTLNLKLAAELLELLVENEGKYSHEAYVKRYLDFMLTPGKHRDTYIEEAHREFFINYAANTPPEKCGVADRHIGGLSAVPALALTLVAEPEVALDAVKHHVGLTHREPEVLRSAALLAETLIAVAGGADPVDEIGKICQDPRRPWAPLEFDFLSWRDLPDDQVIGVELSPACYIDQAFPSALYLAWKYHDDIQQALCVNTAVGGDNCYRGAVVGAILGTALGPAKIPERWVYELKDLHRYLALTGKLFGPARLPGQI